MPSREQERRINADKTSYAPTHDDATVATFPDTPEMQRVVLNALASGDATTKEQKWAADEIERLLAENESLRNKACAYDLTRAYLRQRREDEEYIRENH